MRKGPWRMPGALFLLGCVSQHISDRRPDCGKLPERTRLHTLEMRSRRFRTVELLKLSYSFLKRNNEEFISALFSGTRIWFVDEFMKDLMSI